MKPSVAGVATALLFACAAAPLVHAAGWIDQRHVSPAQGDAAAGAGKATTCVACHGPNGNAVIPTFPRLAGQHADYLAGELRQFKLGNRPDSPMTALAAPLSDEDIRDLSAYFAAQTPTAPAAAATDPAIVSRGENLYLHGAPNQGVPPCQGCHGADANGPVDERANRRAWPALRGQNADYLVQRLQDYRSGKLTNSSNDFVMRGVTQSLDDSSIHALAGWLSSLPPASR